MVAVHKVVVAAANHLVHNQETVKQRPSHLRVDHDTRCGIQALEAGGVEHKHGEIALASV